MLTELMPKRLELLLEVVPQVRVIALLSNPDELSTERIIGHMQEAARAKRVDLQILNARTESEIDGAFATLVQLRADGSSLAPPASGPRSRHWRHVMPFQRLPRNVTSLTLAACSAMARAIPAPIT